MKSSTMLVILVLIFTPYLVNAYKFVGCDFESDYKCEAIHGIGVFVPPAAFVTFWFSDDRS